MWNKRSLGPWMASCCLPADAQRLCWTAGTCFHTLLLCVALPHVQWCLSLQYPYKGLSQISFLPFAGYGDLSLQLGDTLIISRRYRCAYTTVCSFFVSHFSVGAPGVPVNPCWDSKASVLPCEPWHLISKRSALKQGFHLVLKLSLQQADKKGFCKKKYCPFSFCQSKASSTGLPRSTILYCLQWFHFENAQLRCVVRGVRDILNLGGSCWKVC